MSIWLRRPAQARRELALACRPEPRRERNASGEWIEGVLQADDHRHLVRIHVFKRPCGAAVEAIGATWRTDPAARQQAVAKHQLLLKILARFLAYAIGPSRDDRYDLYELRIFVGFLIDVASVSSSVKRVVHQIGLREAVGNAQLRFSSYTSGWNLCEELTQVLASPSIVDAERCCGILLVTDPGSPPVCPFQASQTASDREETCSLTSTRTAATLVSLFSSSSSQKVSIPNERASKHKQLPVVLEQIKEQAADTPVRDTKFRLQTLEEHRFATRFQPKRVTVKTWRRAQRDATLLLRTGDRIKLAEALYLLLEIAWLSPQVAPLAKNYLNIGSIYLTFDHLNEAAKAYRHCLQLDPDCWKARYNLGVTLARLEDFVDATRQLRLALSPHYRPSPELGERIRLILHEIEELQLERNRSAFKQTAKARAFTSQFLNTLHVVSTPGVSFRDPRLASTLSTSKKRSPSKLPPVMFAQSNGWQGAIASLLHRLFVMAWCRGVSVESTLLSKDPSRDMGLPVADLDGIVQDITGTGLSASEQQAVHATFGIRSIAFHFLAPRSETRTLINELQRVGIFRAALDWRLSVRYSEWVSKPTRVGETSGFRYWLTLPMTRWISQVLPHTVGAAAPSTAVVDHALRALGWLTPVDFGLARRPLPLPEELSPLGFAERGVLVFEAHRARVFIQHEACLVIQMMAKRARVSRKLPARRLVLDRMEKHHTSRLSGANSRRGTRSGDHRDREIARHVFATIEALVDVIVEQGALELKTLDLDLTASVVAPVRTEFRLQRSVRP